VLTPVPVNICEQFSEQFFHARECCFESLCLGSVERPSSPRRLSAGRRLARTPPRQRLTRLAARLHAVLASTVFRPRVYRNHTPVSRVYCATARMSSSSVSA
jgi:hypothetical protein